MGFPVSLTKLIFLFSTDLTSTNKCVSITASMFPQRCIRRDNTIDVAQLLKEVY